MGFQKILKRSYACNRGAENIHPKRIVQSKVETEKKGRKKKGSSRPTHGIFIKGMENIGEARDGDGSSEGIDKENINERRSGTHYASEKQDEVRETQKSDPTASITYNTC